MKYNFDLDLCQLRDNFMNIRKGFSITRRKHKAYTYTYMHTQLDSDCIRLLDTFSQNLLRVDKF